MKTTQHWYDISDTVADRSHCCQHKADMFAHEAVRQKITNSSLMRFSGYCVAEYSGATSLLNLENEVPYTSVLLHDKRLWETLAETLAETLISEAGFEYLMIDVTCCKVHSHAASQLSICN